MAPTTRHKLNRVIAELEPGVPVTVRDLAASHISADLAGHYHAAGWLERLARGVYAKPGVALDLDASLVLLQQKIPGLHVAGRSALERHGIQQYLGSSRPLTLLGSAAARLPSWFATRFPASYHRKHLFAEPSGEPLYVHPMGARSRQPLVSDPERALLELLSEVGNRQPLQEARELFESASTIRASALQRLLEHCTSVKTVRLCLALGREFTFPWARDVDASTLPTGSRQRWVRRSPEGLLVLKP
uniref:Transcriptional regulator AbiEi antitoxin N-terminal domain-containing protein n=1 Tax=mine drainage metagenome TaxID=410659 RepID=E6Q3J2_9ZZZZ